MKRTVLFALTLSLITLGCSKNCQKQGVLKNEKRVVNVKREGTLSALILPTEKYLITDLTLKGNLNGVDFKFIREMSGRNYRESITAGKLTRLDLKDANIIESGCYFFSPYTKRQEYCYTKANTIPDFAFQNLSNLRSIILPQSIVSIGTAAFEKCKGLISVKIPSSVNSIGSFAFGTCEGLKQIHCKSNIPPKAESYIFSNTNKAQCKLYVPKGSSANYKSAKEWKGFTTIIEE